MKKRVVLALGGNAILQPGQVGEFKVQQENVEKSSESISRLIKDGHEVVIVHGNGPQVGQILRQNEMAQAEVPVQPLDACSAESQGYIGYMLQQALKNKLPMSDIVTILTMTEVDPQDKAFENPTKPIGSFYTSEEAEKMSAEHGWVMGEDAGRGYRRLVPSPQPKKIVEVDAIKKLLAQDVVVISTGGGGIPVVKNEQSEWEGIAAVIDKDSSAYQLAIDVEADVLMILTDVPNVYLNYGTPEQTKLEEVPVAQAREYDAQGHFSDGSMGPKMKACIEFAALGKTAIICSLEQAPAALRGEAGTRIVG